MNTPEHAQSLETLSQRFEWFAREACHDASPLYEHLCLHIANDLTTLELATYARPGQPVPNLLLAAVQYLLLQGIHHPLSAFYPSIVGISNRSEDPYPYFRSFCHLWREKLIQIISTRLVQTNEVRRCACLLPAFEIVAQRTQRRPLSLVEIGASAGLNLLWDRYGYNYGDEQHYGDSTSPVQLTCTLRGGHRPPLPTIFPLVTSRIGIDLHPINVLDPEDTLWLKALVWPEHQRRLDLLSRALSVVQENPPQILAGDALDLLPGVLATLPQETAPCLFHTFVVNQFSSDARQHLSSLLQQEAELRDLYVISIGWFIGEYPTLGLIAYENGTPTEMRLAQCSGHARWMEWLPGH